MDATTMTQAFDQWFQLRLDSLCRQNEWRKIDCLLASKEYVRDAWEAKTPEGYVTIPVKPTQGMISAAGDIKVDVDFGGVQTLFPSEVVAIYKAMLSAAPKETK